MPIARTAALMALSSTLSATFASAAPSIDPSATAKAEAEIWSREQAIYSSRGSGNVEAYLQSTAAGYLAWPPFNEVPKGVEGLRATGRAIAGKAHEKLEMTLLGFTLNGETAVIYYKTHRTMLADGTPVDRKRRSEGTFQA